MDMQLLRFVRNYFDIIKLKDKEGCGLITKRIIAVEVFFCRLIPVILSVTSAKTHIERAYAEECLFEI